MGLNLGTIYWMDLTFFKLICCKNCIVCLKRLKINSKEAGVGPFSIFFVNLYFCSKYVSNSFIPEAEGSNPSVTNLTK